MGAGRIALLLRLTRLCSTFMRVMEGHDIDSIRMPLLPFTHYPAGKLPYGAQTTIQSLSRSVLQRSALSAHHATTKCPPFCVDTLLVLYFF